VLLVRKVLAAIFKAFVIRLLVKAECPLSSSFPLRRDLFPPVFVMETAEHCAIRDLAVLSEGMSVVTFPRREYRRRFRNPRSEAQVS
jgi:hypothetical protein